MLACLEMSKFLMDEWLPYMGVTLFKFLQKGGRSFDCYTCEEMFDIIRKGKTVLVDTSLTKDEVMEYMKKGFRVMVCFPSDFRQFKRKYKELV